MATARSEQVDLSVTPFYHCMTRCVRRAFLFGDDGYSGKNFDHRKVWVRDRLGVLAELFAIEVCAYAVMSNHLHVVLHVNEELASGFDDEEVVRRYTSLYPMAKVRWELKLPTLERAGLLSEWRSRLTSISWLMRALSEFIARKANKEDRTRGRFWEGRFKSQAILDEQGLLTCMAYVDLNPIRAGLSSSLETSDFTSIQERLHAASANMSQHRERKRKRGAAVASGKSRSSPSAPKHLAAMLPDNPVANGSLKRKSGKRSKRSEVTSYQLPVSLDEYLHLLRWTSGQLSQGADKTSSPHSRTPNPSAGHPTSNDSIQDTPIPDTSYAALSAVNTQPAILRERGIGQSGWLSAMQTHSLGTTRFLGSAATLEKHAETRKSKWLRGIRLARQMAA